MIVGLFNCFVHAVMYLYYLVSAYRPNLKENIEIKKTVTKIQMVRRAIFGEIIIILLINFRFNLYI